VDLLALVRDPVVASVLRSQCVSVGEYAPDITIACTDGELRGFDEFTSRGQAVVMFRHGNWCSACRNELDDVRRLAPLITAAGAAMVVIAPDAMTAPADGPSLEEFATFLADPDVCVASVYGLTISVPAALAEKAGVELPVVDGSGERCMVAAAALIVDRHGIIAWIAVDPDHSSPDIASEMLSELNRLKEI
jgi:peroxiredoxin